MTLKNRVYWKTIRKNWRSYFANSKVRQKYFNRYILSYWENIKGMRNRLIHEYWGTSLEMIYEVSVFEMEDLLKYIYLLREKLKY